MAKNFVLNLNLENMKKFLLFNLVFILSLAVYAQEVEEEVKQKKGFQKENLFVGGNFGLTLGDYTLINISPQVGYRFSKLFAAGIGLNGQYVSYKQRDQFDNPYRKVSQNVTGLNLFARLYPLEQFFVQVQPEANYIFGNQIFYGPPKEEYKLDAVIAPSLLLGGGAALPAGSGAFIISIAYDVLQDKNTPYGKRPVYNFGYNFSL
jgi:hypothetical protein